MSIDLVHNEDHEAEARDLFIEQFKRSTNLRAWMDDYIESVQDVEDVFYQLWSMRGIDAATGAQLDALGVIVGAERNGLDDTDYRIRIRIRIRTNLSSGLDSDISDVFSLLLGANPPITVIEYFPAGFVVWLSEYIAYSTAATLASILTDTRSAGVNAQLAYLTTTAALSFSFSSNPDVTESSTSQGLADDAQTTGGMFADVIEA